METGDEDTTGDETASFPLLGFAGSLETAPFLQVSNGGPQRAALP